MNNRPNILIAILVPAALAAGLAGSAGAATNIVVAITNSTPSNPRVTVSQSFLERSAYEILGTWMDETGTNELTLADMTNSVYLVWKPSDNLDRSPAVKVEGTYVSNGTVKVTIKRDMLRGSGEHYFQVVAEDTGTTNRASFQWTSTVYPSVDQPADEYLEP